MDQDNGPTSLLLYNFLQCSSNVPFQVELKELGSELMRVGPDTDLQIDGSRSYLEMSGSEDLDSESQEEIIRNIAMKLAQIGDEMENSIESSLVNNLIQQFRNVNLPSEDKRKFLAATVEKVMQMQTICQDLRQEKVKLLLAMVLAKKVMTHVPSLFRNIFYITVDYINQNLGNYTRNLTRDGTD
ncbi:BH3-interacting domain death agonist [Macrotis lagotis]|uniref:BH3-interacting domain death agonist n=1 Tax=Macrotis lagotis TaxID=92651 RepID=UPI003D682B50